MSTPFILDPTPTAEIDRIEAMTATLADAVRDLVDATIRTTVDEGQIDVAREAVECVVDLLRVRQMPHAAGVRYNDEGRHWSWGNPVIGARNALAPPLRLRHEDDGTVHAQVRLGAAYEGPPGAVHGGITALLLDHLMGETASARRRATATGTLTLRYLRPTRLGVVHLEGRIAGEDGRKVFVEAAVSDDEGVTVEARGTFVVPRWASSAETVTSEPETSDL